MNCSKCGTYNSEGNNYCSTCGSQLLAAAPAVGDECWGILYQGGYGDGFATSFSTFQTMDEMLVQRQELGMNSVLNSDGTPKYEWIAKLKVAQLNADDHGKNIDARYTVLGWYQLDMNAGEWICGPAVENMPESIGLSNLE